MSNNLKDIEQNAKQYLKDREAGCEDFEKVNQGIISKVMENDEVREVWLQMRAFGENAKKITGKIENSYGIQLPAFLTSENIKNLNIRPEDRQILTNLVDEENRLPALQPTAYHAVVKDALVKQGIQNPSGDLVDAIKNNIETAFREEMAPDMTLPFTPPKTPNMPVKVNCRE